MAPTIAWNRVCQVKTRRAIQLMSRTNRVKFALKHAMCKSVIAIDSDDWYSLVMSDGAVTEIEEVPSSLHGLVSMTTKVVAAASGIINPDPGIDVVRYDPDDKPYIYNIYHYTVIENLPNHPEYPKALAIAGVEDEPELKQTLLDHVFIVGPYHLSDHWSKKIPEHIMKAKLKT